MPQFPLLLNEGDLVDAARGRPEMTDGHGDRGGAEGGCWVCSLRQPSPVPDRKGPGSGYPPAVTGTSLARGTRGAARPPCFPVHSLGWRPARGRTSRVASGRRLTYMAGVAGRGLGRGSDGDGGGGGSRWLRLALATRDWKMAAARHPHPGTAAWAGRGRRHVASGPRGRGAAGPGVA